MRTRPNKHRAASPQKNFPKSSWGSWANTAKASGRAGFTGGTGISPVFELQTQAGRLYHVGSFYPADRLIASAMARRVSRLVLAWYSVHGHSRQELLTAKP